MNEELKIGLHPEKSRVLRLGDRLTFLGFRIFYHHKLLKKSNIRKMRNRLEVLKHQYTKNEICYDVVYDFFEGWLAYAKNADTHHLRKRILARASEAFCGEISTKEINRYLNS